MKFPLSLSLTLLALSTVPAAAAAAGTTAYETIPGHSCFRSMSGMMESMRNLADEYPDLVTIVDIGDSYLKNNAGRTDGEYEIPTGGHDIYAIKVTAPDDGASGRPPSADRGKMLVTSGVHAREYAPPELLARYVEMLVRGYDTDAEITWLLDRTEIHAVLYVNPDGRWMAEKYPELYWRKNLNPEGECGDDRYGVDINRNFDFMWSDPAGASNNPCDDDYHGTSAESEPETQALADYARSLFPEGQRKRDPEGEMNEPFGEEISGMYVDIHSSGGYVYYPWGHRDAQSPDDDALQALGRKINSFNGYKLWAGGQPDFVYEASGDTSDYAYGALGVASFGFEIGDDFYQDCNGFENDIVPTNLPALMYAAKIASKPFKEVKGPDILRLAARVVDENIQVRAYASDSKMVNSIEGFPDFLTGDQLIAKVQVYLDVHPDEYESGDASWPMQPLTRRRLDLESVRTEGQRWPDGSRNRVREASCDSITKKKKCRRTGRCEWRTQTKMCIAANSSGPATGDNSGSTSDGGDSAGNGGDPAGNSSNPTGDGGSVGNGSIADNFDSGEAVVEVMIDTTTLARGRHTLFVQATDSEGYKGPVSSVFIEISPQRQREYSLRHSTSLRGGAEAP